MPAKKKTTRILPAQKKLKGVKKVFGSTINQRPLKDYMQDLRTDGKSFSIQGTKKGECQLDIAKQASINCEEEAAKDSAEAFLVKVNKILDSTIYNLHKEEEKKMNKSAVDEQGPCSKEPCKPSPIKEQMTELEKSIYAASEMLDRLENKLQPVRFTRRASPLEELGAAVEGSDVFKAIRLTTFRIDGLRHRITQLEEEIEL